ncbi:MAG: hypothetical protein A3A81_07685 [Omnitrophica bacterium RIFCSPLOWO2_01_FULL_45_10b]|nr:MAG: hypothetical protein A3A81_07685 [Omnitrophica bacterium RIFCSPLOWO2_01_FULL_45_10b]
MAIRIPNLSKLASIEVSSFFKKTPPKTQGERKVGLNIGHGAITACEVSFGAQHQLILEQCARKEIVKDKPIASQLKDFLHESKFQSKQVNMSLKGHGVVVRFLSFPKMNRSDFASSIQFEAEKYLPFSLSEVVLDYQIIEDIAVPPKTDLNTMKVILVAARKTEIDKLVNLAQEIGFKLNVIDVDVFAYVNAFEHSNPEVKNQSVALIDFGAGDTTLAVVDKGALVFSRDIAFGGDDLTEMIHRKLNVPVEEALKIQLDQNLSQPEHKIAVEEGLSRLFQELRSSLNFYYNQNQTATPVETIYVSGGLSQLGVLLELLEKQIETPIKKWDPTSQFTLGEKVSRETLDPLTPYLPVCIGLAIRSK